MDKASMDRNQCKNHSFYSIKQVYSSNKERISTFQEELNRKIVSNQGRSLSEWVS